MATHANSTPAPERTLLREAAAPGRLLSAEQREQELIAILDAGPVSTAGWGFMDRQQRRRAEAGVTALIAALDALESDPDLEEGGDLEPVMGWPENGGGRHYGGSYRPNDDECEDCHDHEHSLGAPEVEYTFNGRPNRHGHIDQRRWADGSNVHGEHEPTLGSPIGGADWWDRHAWSAGYQRRPEHDEVEDVAEDEGADVQAQPHDADAEEPSLGSPEHHHDQRRWGEGQHGSVEMDHDEQHLAASGWEEVDRIRRARRDAEAMLSRRGLRSPSTLVTAGNMMPLVTVS